MLQFYFLSVLLNIITGFVLVYASGKFSNGFLSNDLTDTSDFKNQDSSVEDDFFNELDESDGFETKKAFKKNEINNSFTPFVSFLNDKIFRLVLGITSSFVGLVKLFYTVQNDIAVIGDFLPSIAGLLGGACLLIEYFGEKAEYGLNLPESLDKIFGSGKKYLGFFCILAGLLHFIFPRALFL